MITGSTGSTFSSRDSPSDDPLHARLLKLPCRTITGKVNKYSRRRKSAVQRRTLREDHITTTIGDQGSAYISSFYITHDLFFSGLHIMQHDVAGSCTQIAGFGWERYPAAIKTDR